MFKCSIQNSVQFKWLLRVMSSQLLARSKFNYLYTIVTISEPKSGTSKLENAQMADCLLNGVQV
jgi:hypothetical protein